MGQAFPKEKLDTELQAVFEKNELMGMSVILLKEDSIVYEGSFGLADSARQIPVMEQTVYRVASISKTMTAAALMQLWEQGKVDLDADVSQYLGWPLRHPKHPDTPITLRLLMSHRSGIRDGEGYSRFSREMIGKQLDIRELFLSSGAYFTDDLFGDEPPGAFFSYANCAWGLVAGIVEKVSGQRFDVYCRENLFKPLGMTASFNVLDLPDLNDLAVLYRYSEGQWTPQADDYRGEQPEPRVFEGYQLGQNGLIFGPQGSLRSSARDLAAFARMLMNGGTLDGRQVLKASSVDLMLSNHWTFNGENGDTWDAFWQSYGLGVHRLLNRDSADIIFPDRTMAGHPGIAYGLLSDMYFDPATRTGVVFITNGSKQDYEYGPGTAFYRVEEEVFRILFGYL